MRRCVSTRLYFLRDRCAFGFSRSPPTPHPSRLPLPCRETASIRESRGVPARDLENDVSGPPKPPDEIRMIDGVSGSRGRLDYIIRLRTPTYRVFLSHDGMMRIHDGMKMARIHRIEEVEDSWSEI